MFALLHPCYDTKGLPCITSSQIWSSSLESSSCETDLRDARINERKKLLKDAQMKRAEDILTTICPETNLSPLQCLLELLLNGKTQHRGVSLSRYWEQ